MKVWVNKPCVLCGKTLSKRGATKGEPKTGWRIHSYPCKQTLDGLRDRTPKVNRTTNYMKFGEFYHCRIDNMKIKIYQ